ncbi:MAG: TRAP transporter small permease subunit [Desulfobacterales bacterium]|jgi:TRAP-type C4-dicarboxylate transport system permease small subunit
MFLRYLYKIDDSLALVEKAMACLLFLGLTLITFGTIVARNLFSASSQQLLEVAPAGVLWIALVGASLALRQGRHIRLELLLRFAPDRIRRGAGVAVSLFGAAVMGILLAASFGFVQNEVAIFGARGWTAAIFPFFFTVAAFRYLLGIFRTPSEEDPMGRGEGSPNG